ncbi:MAG: bifunctional 5,10-methylenetetrahydrofolate dehydrogenase/5,10-methenyltetrahydrofolate cyclohydrolase [Coprobacillus sp.]|nr:bifunctional 5,10-methylenetetrahydrofolate dehydrogenase/5,10-methenyltetrahydrofolate cyclohydrolase [Coprobacillus sp.]
MEIVDYVAGEKEKLKNEINRLEIKPFFVIIQINEDEGSNIYIKGKIKDAGEVGIEVEHIKLPLDIKEKEVIDKIEELNKDPKVNGIIVQLPVPEHINEEHIKGAISPEKDIDGFNPFSKFIPCTPKGILDYLDEEGIEIEGKNTLVIGRSSIVGKPMARELLKRNGNVTVLHSKTKREDMERYVASADLIVVATGHKYLLDHTFTYKEDATVVDVGITRIDGKIYGDCEPGLPVKLQTPVPKGVGLLTRLSLLKNVMEAYYHEF